MSASFTQLVESTFVTAYFQANGITTPSIRQICVQALIRSGEFPVEAGALKREAQRLVERYHPTSAAAKKFTKHYAWYKGTLIKEGKVSRFSYPTDDRKMVEQIKVADTFQVDLGATPLDEVKDQLIEVEQGKDLQDVNRCSICGNTEDDCFCDD